jgi:dTDP-4-dehydrorhamnose reductase
MPGGTAATVLIVGHGLIGGAVRTMLQAQDVPVSCVSRRHTDLPGCRTLDLASRSGRAALQSAICELHPRCVLLVHGPSDVTWIDANAAAAAAVHCRVAAIAACSAPAVILVSTDNVFPGTRSGYRPDDPVQPANSYGQIKSLAEQTVLAGRAGMVLRVSLVYGWAGPRLRSTYAQRCIEAAEAGRPMSAPVDQVFTPIHVRDAAAVIAAMCRSAARQPDRHRPGGPCPGARTIRIRHLAGPANLSRYEFTRLAYELAGADMSLVRPCLRQDTEWACRPRYSSLACGTFADLPGLAGWRPMTPADGLRDMLAASQAGASRPDSGRA